MPVPVTRRGAPGGEPATDQLPVVDDVRDVNAPPAAIRETPAPPVAQPAGRTVCPTCEAAYFPRLVKDACPVCGTPAPGTARPRRSPLGDDDRLLLIVALATVANLLVLGILAVAVLN